MSEVKVNVKFDVSREDEERLEEYESDVVGLGC